MTRVSPVPKSPVTTPLAGVSVRRNGSDMSFSPNLDCHREPQRIWVQVKKNLALLIVYIVNGVRSAPQSPNYP